jgi:hypothetical protein
MYLYLDKFYRDKDVDIEFQKELGAIIGLRICTYIKEIVIEVSRDLQKQ